MTELAQSCFAAMKAPPDGRYAGPCCCTLTMSSQASTELFIVPPRVNQPLHCGLRHCAAWLFAGVKQLLQYPSLPDGALHFAAVEGLSCQTGLLDGPASLLTSLLACGSTSDASLAAIQAGQSAFVILQTMSWHAAPHINTRPCYGNSHGQLWAINSLW